MSGSLNRRTPDNPVRENDFVTMAQCAKIAVGAANLAVRNAIDEYDRLRRANVWYRRWWRTVRRHP